MTCLLPSLSWPEFCLKSHWNQSELRIFLLVISVKAPPSASSSESKHSAIHWRFSFLHPQVSLCHLPLGLSLLSTEDFHISQLYGYNRFFLWLLSFGSALLWSVLYMPAGMIRPFMTVITTIYGDVRCIIPLSQTDT